jgi:hypothetical protein
VIHSFFLIISVLIIVTDIITIIISPSASQPTEMAKLMLVWLVWLLTIFG